MSPREIDAATARAWIAQGDTVLIDVREPGEHARESIPGARLVPLGELSADTLARMTGQRVIVHCASGARSSRAAAQLTDAGCEVVSLKGGLASWRAAGGPVKEDRTAPIPIQRQVMLVAGALVVLGITLGTLVHPWFVFLSGFVGAGLMVAGATGFCGMALLLAKLPYNRVSAPSHSR